MGESLDEVLRRAAVKVRAERREQRLLLDLLVQELVELDVRNRDQVRLERTLVAEFEAIRSSLSPGEKDLFLRAILDDVRGIADNNRARLREIVRRHVRRSANRGDP